jgi:tRNA(fMet)-specific endonuclease VapC
MAGEPAIRQRVTEAEQVLLHVVVAGELYFGAERSGKRQQNLQRVEALLATANVVGVSLETARNYGLIKTALRRKGLPIPDNDLWIAAAAIEYGAAIATRDAHFDAIENVAVIRW